MTIKLNEKEIEKDLFAVPNNIKNNQIYTVVVPIFDDEQAEWTVQLGLDLARARRGRVILVGMVLIPAKKSLSTGAVQAQECRTTLETLRSRFEDAPLFIKPRVRVAHKPWQSLAQVIVKEHASLVILPWRREGTKALFGAKLDKLIGHLDCHIVVAHGEGPVSPHRILMPIRGSQETPLTLEVGLSLAKASDAEITLLYAAEDDESRASQKVYNELVRMSQGNPLIKEELRVKGDVISAVIERVEQHDLIILGVSDAWSNGGPQMIGQVARQLRRAKTGPMLVVKTHQPPPVSRLAEWREAGALPPTNTSVVVDKWFAENTFNSQEFADLEHLVTLKEAQNLTVSLGLPALNEEETVGKIIEIMQNNLMNRFPLLDEIVLIDSGSTDYTVDIALDLGVPVFQHQEILPRYGTYRGKGEALWKSLHVLKGDLIAWIDTDIVNIHPRFVYGILGPLLRHDTIQYVKGFYRRPLKVGDTLQAGGGGRVTELVARPLINLFYPELSGIVQPLAGEYAGRRSALERTPFYVGYGVETGLLLDLVERYGISGIAQVDLRKRIHRNQSLTALSRMSFAIIQVFIDYLERRQRDELLRDINRTMKIIRYEPDQFSLMEHAITDQQRPPIIVLPEYRKKHGIIGWKPEEFKEFDQKIFDGEILV
jgi:glucosyl-3-phosphoglycerate synthase